MMALATPGNRLPPRRGADGAEREVGPLDLGRLQGKNIAQVYAQADRQADLAAMGLAALVTKANTLTADIEQLMQQRQPEA